MFFCLLGIICLSNDIRSMYGIKILKTRHKILRELNKNADLPTMHGDQVWQSSFLIMDYLTQHPLPENVRVMDIGCGWGLLGIYCAKHFAADVLMVDADASVFPYTDSHTLLNEVTARTAQARFSDLNASDFSCQDVIMGADICFWPELSTQLKGLVSVALNSGVKRIILADPGRSTFLQLANFCRSQFGAKLYSREIPGRTRFKGYLLDINLSH